jgi:hypothetical protein
MSTLLKLLVRLLVLPLKLGAGLVRLLAGRRRRRRGRGLRGLIRRHPKAALGAALVVGAAAVQAAEGAAEVG